MNKFRYDSCDCGLCDGNVHAYIWTADGQKFGPFTRSFNMVIAFIEIALSGLISESEAIEGGMFALQRLSSSFDGEMATPALEGLAHVKERVGRDGYKLAEVIFQKMIDDEKDLEQMFEQKFQPRLQAVR